MREATVPVEPATKKKSGIGKNILIVVIAGLVINVVLGLVSDFRNILAAIVTAGPWDIAAPFVCGLAVFIVDSFRFILVFKQFRVRLSFGDSLYSNLIGFFFSGITPSATGGQPFQIFHFKRLGLDSTVSTNIVFSRLMVASLSQLLIIAAVALSGHGFSLFGIPGVGGYILGFGLAVSLCIFILLVVVFAKPSLLGHFALWIDRSRLGRLIGRLVKNDRWAEKFSVWSFGLGDSFKHLWSNRFGFVLVDLGLQCVDQVLWSLGLYVPFRSLTGADMSFLSFVFAFNLCGLVSSFIPTPGATGSIEATYAIVLDGFTSRTGAVPTAIMIWRFGSYYLFLLVAGLVYTFVHPSKNVYASGPGGLLARRRDRAQTPAEGV
jgi:uncharacterized protein (TIRG00374 family)